MIIVAFYQNICREYILPNEERKTDAICLEKDVFGLKRSIQLHLDQVNGRWTMFCAPGNCFLRNGVRSDKQDMQTDEAYHLYTAAEEQIDLLCYIGTLQLPVMDKYLLPTDVQVTIGAAGDNTFPFSCHNYVSRHHAVLHFQQDRWYLTDSSANGTFLNGVRISGSVQLHFGDVIDIFGLKLVYLGKLLAVCRLFGERQREAEGLMHYDVLHNSFGEAGHGQKMPFFNRPPRNLQTIHTGVVDIDSPPARAEDKRKPLLAVIGPSLTMALPMLLGYGMMAIGMNGRSPFMFMGVFTALGSAIMGSVWAMVNIQNQEMESKAREDKRFHTYGNYLLEISHSLAEQYRQNYQAMHAIYPATCTCADYDRNSSLWNRNVSQGDFLYERLGLGDIPFQVEIHAPKKGFSLNADKMVEFHGLLQEEFRTLRQVPVGIDLLQHQLVGIVGHKNIHAAETLARTILCQIAANCCYTDVKIVLLNQESGAEAQKNWGFLRWMPHSWSADHTFRYFSMNTIEAETVSYELTKVLRRRANGEETIIKPYYIVIMTDVSLLDCGLLSNYVLYPKPAYGVTTLILSDSYGKLPNSCNYAIEGDGKICCINDMMDVNRQQVQITQDQVSVDKVWNMAYRLANIQVEEKEINQDIPSSVDFLSMYGVTKLSELQIASRWRLSRTWETMRVPVGVRAGGQLCFLDIHERFHGPHGLVAGTTGSGKSETLQSYILSLCVNFSPEDITFFLIDYKGGGMANLFQDLPHLVGQISNLSGNQIRRAMISIKSESVRRQRMFNEVGVNNINHYTQMYKNGECDTAIPHLLIIIDEFAELRKAEPDFMRELISVAQVGRSLGIHLILATQKPSGTVDDNIRSNSKFRLCLRVQDRQDSNDMLHRPDAAYITQAGGCILQVGNDEIFELFQSAWSGAVYDEENSDNGSAATMLTHTGRGVIAGNRLKIRRMERKRMEWYGRLVHAVRQVSGGRVETLAAIPMDQLGQAVMEAMQRDGWNGKKQALTHLETLIRLWPEDAEQMDDMDIANVIVSRANASAKLPVMEEHTQLDVLVSAIAQTAALGHYQPAYQLWLPVLPHVISLDRLEGWDRQSYENGAWQRMDGTWTLETMVGLLDDPVNQAQFPLYLDLAHNGHHAVLGTVSSGKSTFLQTALYGFFNAYSPQQLHTYIIDFSSRMLGIFHDLPHVGGIVFENEPEKTDKLFYLLSDILKQRKELLQGGSFREYVRTHRNELPAILLVVDNYASFKEKTDGKYEQQMMQLSREGMGYGIFLLLSSSGFGMNEISSRMGENLRTVFCLEMTDKFKYAESLRMTGIGILPESGVHGRGLVRYEDRCLEYQTALMNRQTDDYARGECAAKLFDRMKREWKGTAARRIPEIPANPTYSLLCEMAEYRQAEPHMLPVGYAQDTATIYSIDLSATYCYLILGQPHTGKSNLLQLILRAGAEKPGAEISLYCGENSQLQQAAAACGASVITTDGELFQFFKQLTPKFIQRNRKKQEYLSQGMTDTELFESMQQYPPVFLLVDDLAAFFQMIYKPAEGVGAMNKFVENIMEKGALHNIYIFGCANTNDLTRLAAYKAYSSFVSGKKGMLLGTAINAQRVFEFGKVPFAEANKTLPKGIGAASAGAAEGSELCRVVLPLAGR